MVLMLNCLCSGLYQSPSPESIRESSQDIKDSFGKLRACVISSWDGRWRKKSHITRNSLQQVRPLFELSLQHRKWMYPAYLFSVPYRRNPTWSTKNVKWTISTDVLALLLVSLVIFFFFFNQRSLKFWTITIRAIFTVMIKVIYTLLPFIIIIWVTGLSWCPTIPTC